jgi:hypothetical protein
MRRVFVAFLAVTMGLLAFSAVPADAASVTYFSNAVSGPFTGTSVFDAENSCALFHQVYDATYTDKHGNLGSVDLDGCVTIGAGTTFEFAGTFKLATAHRAMLQGTVSGTVSTSTATGCGNLSPTDLDFTLVLAQGNRGFRDLDGTIHLQGVWCSPAVPDESGPISGQLTGDMSAIPPAA